MIIVDSGEMALIDRNTQNNFGYPSILLMENAGINCYRYIEENIFPTLNADKTLFICGKGNNGGDALVMARHHFLNRREGIIIMTGIPSGEGPAAVNFTLCRDLGIKIIYWNENSKEAVEAISVSSLIIDGISGTGLKGMLKDSEADLCEEINASKAFVCSIDIPSGIGDNFQESYPSVSANLTITIGLPKLSLYYPSSRKRCGRIVLSGAGFPPSMLDVQNPSFLLIDPSDAESSLRFPDLWSYKNSRGHVSVYAGSKGKSGAAILCSRAALNSLAGLVTLFTDNDIYDRIAGSFLSVMIDTFDKDTRIDEHINKFDAMVAGPGWGKDSLKTLFLEKLLQESDKPLVIDADGIAILSDIIARKGLSRPFNNRKCIITPHPGEFARLVNKEISQILDNPAPLLKSFCMQSGLITVLKSHVTWICLADGRIMILDRMNPALSTAGSGDILAGIIGGLLAGGTAVENAAVAGVVIHSKTGEKCFADKGFFSSDEMLGYIPLIIKNFRQVSDGQ